MYLRRQRDKNGQKAMNAIYGIVTLVTIALIATPILFLGGA